jgi:hypothetical protein
MPLPFLASFFIQLAVGLALMVISYAIMPKPKQQKPEAAKDLEAPTAEAGRPIPVVFGTMTVKSANIIDVRDKGQFTRSIPA